MYRKSFQALFTIFCWTTFTFMVIYWLYKYKVIDRDIGVLSLISLEEAKDIEFPIPSLCLIEPFVDKSFDINHSNINSTEYVKYLKGNASLNSVGMIDYERVTLNLNNYFLFATEVWKNDSIQSCIKIRNSMIVGGIDNTIVYNDFNF